MEEDEILRLFEQYKPSEKDKNEAKLPEPYKFPEELDGYPEGENRDDVNLAKKGTLRLKFKVMLVSSDNQTGIVSTNDVAKIAAFISKYKIRDVVFETDNAVIFSKNVLPYLPLDRINKMTIIGNLNGLSLGANDPKQNPNISQNVAGNFERLDFLRLYHTAAHLAAVAKIHIPARLYKLEMRNIGSVNDFKIFNELEEESIFLGNVTLDQATLKNKGKVIPQDVCIRNMEIIQDRKSLWQRIIERLGKILNKKPISLDSGVEERKKVELQTVKRIFCPRAETPRIPPSSEPKITPEIIPEKTEEKTP